MAAKKLAADIENSVLFVLSFCIQQVIPQNPFGITTEMRKVIETHPVGNVSQRKGTVIHQLFDFI